MEYMVINALLRIPGHKEELQPLRDGHRAVGPPQGLPVIPYANRLSPIQEISVLRRASRRNELSSMLPQIHAALVNRRTECDVYEA